MDLLIRFGSTEQTPGGASKVFFDKPAPRRLQSYAGPLVQMLDRHLDIYAVIGENEQVVTVGHRLDRIKRR